MLRLDDLEQSKNAVPHPLGAASSQESYGHAIDEFIGWYCSEPRLSFNRDKRVSLGWILLRAGLGLTPRARK
jgi:hypothetical protein